MAFENAGVEDKKMDNPPSQEDPEKEKIIKNHRLLSELRYAHVLSDLNKDAYFNIPFGQVMEAAQNGVITSIKTGETEKSSKIIETFGISSQFLQSEEVQEAVREGAATYLRNGRLDKAEEINNLDYVQDDIFDRPEIQKIIIEQIVLFAKLDMSDKIEKFKERPWFSDEIMQAPEIQKIASEKVLACIEKGEIGEAFEIIEEYKVSGKGISGTEKTKAVTNGVISLLEKSSFNAGDYEKILNIHLSGFLDLPHSFFSGKEFDSAAGKAYMSCIKSGDTETAKKIKDKFNIPQSDVKS